jgi:alkylated DNA nucleotide flippase Atl1
MANSNLNQLSATEQKFVISFVDGSRYGQIFTYGDISVAMSGHTHRAPAIGKFLYDSRSLIQYWYRVLRYRNLAQVGADSFLQGEGHSIRNGKVC